MPNPKYALHINENYLAAVEGMIGPSSELDILQDLFLLVETVGPAEFNAKIVSADHLLDDEGVLMEDIQIVAV